MWGQTPCASSKVIPALTPLVRMPRLSTRLLAHLKLCPMCCPQVSKELDQPADNVSEMQLSHALRSALAASCAKYEEEDVAERLRAKKDRSATG